MHDSAPERSTTTWLPRLARGGALTALLLMASGLIAADEQAPPAHLLHQRMLASDLVEADPRALAVVDGSKREFSGRVVDADGKPVAGVDVHAWDWLPGNETHTAADGTFRLAGFDPNITIE